MGTVRLATLLALPIACTAAPDAHAQSSQQDLRGYVTLASGYWKRGLAQNEGASAQIGIDFTHHTGFYVGAGAANVDFDLEYSASEPRRIEANVYVGYQKRREQWSWNVGLGRYLYPGAAIDYDYNEVTGTVGFRQRLFYTAGYSGAYYGGRHSALNQEVSLVFPLRGNMEIGGAVGKFRIAGDVLDITYWNAGATKLLRRWAFDMRYYDGDSPRISYYGDPDARHVVLSVSYAFGGRKPRT